MHQADAGSDAYDRDFALSLLSQEQDALYEIDQALKRIESEPTGNARCRVNLSRAHVSKRFRSPVLPLNANHSSRSKIRATRIRPSVTSLFGLTEEEGGEAEEEETTAPEVKE